MLPRCRLLQIGDVHLPGARLKPRPIDEKDKRFPVDLKHIISGQPTKRVFKKIYERLQSGEVEAIIFMGDLTDLGDLDGYRSCAKYIANALQLGESGVMSDVKCGIVFGNHDINRALAQEPGLTQKFAPLSHALRAEGLPPPTIGAVDWMSLERGHARATVALLNSCWGCGAKEFIPEEFRADVAAAIDAALARGGDERVTRAYYDRQFDTPAFSDDTLDALANPPTEMGNGLLIACAHHNLFPQRQPRLAPYTELINSGAVRGTLLELARPVVYLHGHIHEDPIEVLLGDSGEPLVSISAPEASEGFNEIEFVFNSAGAPLSCRVTKWRFDKSGVFRSQPPRVISLLGHRRRATDRSLSQLYAKLLDETEMYWSQIMSMAEDIFSGDTAIKLEEALELLATDGRVEIENYSSTAQNWIVRGRL